MPNPQPVGPAVGARVALERRRHGWSGHELAKRLTDLGCAMSQSAVSRLEGGQRRIDVDELAALAAVFNLPIEALFRGPSRHDLGEEIRELLELFDLQRHRLVRNANEVSKTMQQLGSLLIRADGFDPDALDAAALVEQSLVRLFDLALQVEARLQGVEPQHFPQRFVRPFN